MLHFLSMLLLFCCLGTGVARVSQRGARRVCRDYCASILSSARQGQVPCIAHLPAFQVCRFDLKNEPEHRLFLSIVVLYYHIFSDCRFLSTLSHSLSHSFALSLNISVRARAVSRSCSRCRRCFAPPISLPSASRLCARNASGTINHQLRDMIQTLARTQYSSIANSY